MDKEVKRRCILPYGCKSESGVYLVAMRSVDNNTKFWCGATRGWLCLRGLSTKGGVNMVKSYKSKHSAASKISYLLSRYPELRKVDHCLFTTWIV